MPYKPNQALTDPYTQGARRSGLVISRIMRMSAFPNSGHSIRRKSTKSNVRFRPIAVIRVQEKPRRSGVPWNKPTINCQWW